MLEKIKKIPKIIRRKKFVPLLPRKFIIIRWKRAPSTNEEISVFDPRNRIVEVYHTINFREPVLVDVQDYIEGMEKLYEMDGYFVLDLTTGVRTSDILVDSAVSWDIGALRSR